MTALLLDTHAFVFAVKRPDLLSPTAHDAITDPTHEVLVSAASAWEIATKVRLGRWPEAESLATTFGAATDGLAARVLPMTVDDALTAGGLSWGHGDPFDRMLVAQAMHEGAVIVTRDQAIRERPGVATLW